jgi:hypothetical protein
MSSAEYEETINGEERFGYGPWRDDPLGTGGLLSRKRQQRGWQDSAALSFFDGLEDSVRHLFDGNVTESLPWAEQNVAKEQDRIATASKSGDP